MPTSKSKSRRETPWDTYPSLTPTQSFLREHYLSRYKDRHPKLTDTQEERLINSHVPSQCPYCGSISFVKRGFTKNHVQRYKCSSCSGTFTPVTGTIFDGHRLAISEWTEFCLNLFRNVSINADSWNNKNSFSTSKYWLKKLFLTLENYQEPIVVGGRVWLDETFYPVVKSKIVKTPSGTKPRGLSKNQICIGVATDKDRTICFVEGYGKPSQKRSLDTFKEHIATGSTLVHDKDNSHKKLLSALSLTSEVYDARALKGVPDSHNPLDPINETHNRLKLFLRAHSGFNRDDLQGYLDLFSFMRNPPSDSLLKVEELLKLAFTIPKSLKYRDQFL